MLACWLWSCRFSHYQSWLNRILSPFNRMFLVRVVERAEGQLDACDVDERAAIAIHDGGIPDAYGDAFARLQSAQLHRQG